MTGIPELEGRTMYLIIAPLQIKEGHKEQFVEEIIADARGSLNNEPGCLRFDVVQDPENTNRIWLYEVYTDEQAFQAHTRTPHFTRWRDATRDWLDEAPLSPSIGGANIWPPDEEWK